MKLPWKIALRFLLTGKAQTIFIVLGIAVGVSVQIFIGLLIQGLQKSLINTTIGSSSQITVKAGEDGNTIGNWKDIKERIKAQGKEFKYVSATADASGFVKVDGKSKPVLMRGVDLQVANGIYKFDEKLKKGVLPRKINQVIIGKDLSEELGIGPESQIEIFTPEGKTAQVTVAGIADFEVAELNKTWVITNMETVQGIFSLGDKATSIEMQVNDVFKADTLALLLKNALNDQNLTVEDWKTQNASLLSGLKGQSMSSLMIQVFVLIAVVLGIASVLAVSVIQKSRQLGILKAMGMKDRTASLTFLLQGLILGVAGAGIGILLGMGLCLSFTKFALNPDGTPIVELYINTGFIVVSGIIAVAAAVIASGIPARRSLKLSPVEVIKNG